MISQNIKFKPIYKRSKTFTLPLWVANPLRLCNRLRTKVKNMAKFITVTRLVQDARGL